MRARSFACILLALAALPARGWAEAASPATAPSTGKITGTVEAPLRKTVPVTNHYFRRIDASDGVQQGGLREIYQDHRGFIWLVTPSSLFRFDGRHLLSFPDALGTPATGAVGIASLADAGEGRYWLSLRQSPAAPAGPDIKLFQPSLGPLPLPAGLAAPGSGASLLSLPGQRLLMAGPTGISQWDEKTAMLSWLWRAPAGAGGTHTLTLCGAGTAYALDNGDLFRIEQAPARARPITMPGNAGNEGRALACSHAGNLLLGTSRGVYALDTPHGWSRLWPATGAPPQGVEAVTEDASGILWVAPSTGGLLRLGPHGDARRVPAEHGMRGDLPPGVILKLRITHDNTLWAIVGTAGLVYTDPEGTRFQSVTVPDQNDPEDKANYIRSVAPAPHGMVWVGSHAGLMLYNPQTRQLHDYTPLIRASMGLPADSTFAVEGIVHQADGRKLWLATNLGLLGFDPTTGAASPAYTHDPGNPLPGQWLYTVWRAPDGTYWIAGATNGVAHWRPGQAAPQWLANPSWMKVFPHVYGFTATPDGSIWMAASDGVLRWHDGKLRLFQHQPGQSDSLSNNSVISVATGADGALWVGSIAGVDRMQGMRDGAPVFRHYGKRQGLPDDVVYCMVEQPRGTLWAGTNFGIASLDYTRGLVAHYGRSDGIRGLESNSGTCTRLDNGDIVFGGPEGFVVGHTTPGPALPAQNVQLTSMRIGEGNESLPPPSGPLLVPLGDTVRLRFSVLDYSHPTGLLYRYRLLGRNDHWSQAAATQGVIFTGLPTGRYVFDVSASDTDGKLLGSPTRLDILVVAPWWNSPAMRALYAMLAGGLTLLLIGLTWSRRRAESNYRQESDEREQRLKLALWGSGDALWELDLQRGLLHRTGNQGMHGGPREEVISVDDWRRYAIHPEDLPGLERALAEHLTGKTSYFESEHRLRGTDNNWVWIRARGKISEFNDEGHPLRITGTSRDIDAELARERERSINDLVVRSMGEAVAVTDAEMRFVAINPAFTRMTGYHEVDVIGRPTNLLDSPDQPDAYAQERARLEAQGHFQGELWQRKRDGEPILCQIEINEIRDSHGERTHFVAVLTDVTARRRAEQELHYLANYDPLTGLPNRTLLTERLGDAVLRARQMNRLVAVLFVDLDRFKHVNDAHGHSVGDRVLQAAARRLRTVVRDDDTVARLGGDEFTVVLERVAQTSDAEEVAQKVLNAFEEPMDLGDGREAHITPSIGIALYPTHGQIPTDLLKFADIAMYRAKERGRNTWSLYTEALDAEVRQHADLITALQRALKRDEFSLVYQPKLSLAEERITGVEALLRWESEEFGVIPPSLFIPLAEEIGLIGLLGEFVIERACAELAVWRAAGIDGVTMAVNVSAAQLGHGDINATLMQTLARHGLPPQLLELELTESMLMQDPERSRAILETLNTVGVTLAIDDFGTGYSSLAYLQRLPLDTLKIDQTFVAKLTHSVDDETILGTIVLMAHALGLNVIAEGVETSEQVEYLREKDCDEIQGYLVSRPMPGPACMAFIQQQQSRRTGRPA